MTDIVFCTIPKRTTNLYYATQLPESLARLKGSVESSGFKAKNFDFNIEYYRKAFLSRNVITMDEYFDGFNLWHEEIADNPDDKQWINQTVTEWCDKIIAEDPVWLGISLFTNYCITATYLLSKQIRKRAPHIKIVIGGFATDTYIGFFLETMKELSGLKTLSESDRVADFFVRANLVDAFICGEGELSIIELLKGNMDYPGINNYAPEQIFKVEEIAEPDFSDHVLSNYVFPNVQTGQPFGPMFPVTSSRGCINRCNFCNIGALFPKFRLFKPEFIFDQIIHNYKTYGVTEFRFTDSIINASPNHMAKWLEMLVKYQKDNNVKFGFEGSFIVQPKERFGEYYYNLLKEAGFSLLAFGLETGSEKVRYEMNKQQTNDEVHYFVEQCLKAGLRLSMSTIIGYPTETRKDFEDTLNFFKHYEKQVKSREITFELSTFTTIDCDMPLLKCKEIDLQSVNNTVGGWVANTPCDSFYTALLRTKEADQLLDNIGYYVNNTAKMKYYDDMLNDPRYKDYYTKWKKNRTT